MKKAILITFLILSSQFSTLSARAGGPFIVDPLGEGIPITWRSNTIRWIVDGGDLSPQVPHEKAVVWIAELFNIWSDASLEDSYGRPVDVVDLNFEYVGYFNADIDISNYKEVLSNDYDAAIIIFDEDGSIIDWELKGLSDFVVGYASPFYAGEGLNFSGGVVVINGLFVDGDNENSGEISERAFKAAMLHELGHLLNLDHTQANIEAAERADEGDYSLLDEIPTMYPILYTEEQIALHADDVVALAEQYPNADYLNGFCRIEGELVNGSGSGVQGADVVARASDPLNEWSDVRSVVSGVFYPEKVANGGYALGGLVPGREYKVGYREISPIFRAGASIEPYDPPKGGIGSGSLGDGAVMCDGGGAVVDVSGGIVEGDTLAVKPASGDDLEPQGDATQPAAGCSLIR